MEHSYCRDDKSGILYDNDGEMGGFTTGPRGFRSNFSVFDIKLIYAIKG